MSVPPSETSEAIPMAPSMQESKIPPLIGVSHDDGDIMLATGEHQDVVEETFRVHRAIVCLHSSVFRDLLSNATPDKLIERCPVVRCLDSASDVRVLLSALYNGLAILCENHLTLDGALSILRLSDKYRIEGLQGGITRVLLEDWPLNYEDYLNRQKLLGSPGCRVLDSMKIIKTAQLCGVTTLLPAAFYEVAAVRIQDWKDVDLDTSQQYLSWKDVARLLAGRERSVQRLQSLVKWDEESLPTYWRGNRAPTDTPATIFQIQRSVASCSWNGAYSPNSYYCPSLFTVLATQIGRKLLEGISPFRILRELERSDLTDACLPCIEWFFTTVLPNKELEIWESIPMDFDLPEIDKDLYATSMFKSL